MSKNHRVALLLALAAGVFHAVLASTVFPAEVQFTKYPHAAAQLLSGTLPPGRLLDFSPLYLYLHVALSALLPGAARAVVGVQVAAVAGATALMFLLLVRHFPLWLAVAGAVAFLTNRAVTVYAAVLEPEAFLLLFLLAFLHFSQGEAARDRAIAGVALALGLAVRPSVLPLLAVVPLYFFLLLRDGGGQGQGRAVTHGYRRWLGPSVRVLAPSLLVLLALGARNAASTGSFSPLGMNPGFVFYEGNNPLSSGRSSVNPPIVGELKPQIPEHPDNPHLTYRLVAERSSGRELSTDEANRYWRQKAFSFMADHPGRYARLLGTKAQSALHAYRAHDLIPAERYDRRLAQLRVPALPFALLVSLALAGLVVSLPRWRRFLLLYALFASQFALMLMVYVSERQRLALLPAVVFFAASALAWLVAAPRRRAGVLAVCLPLALLLTLPNDRIREDRHLWSAYELRDPAWTAAVRLRDEGNFADAAYVASVGYALAPWLRDYARPAGLDFGPEGFAAHALDALDAADPHPSRRFDRANLLIDAGRLDEAETLLLGLLAEGHRFDRGFLESSEPLHGLGRIEALRGRTAEAVQLLERALSAAPGDPFVLARLAALTGQDAYRAQIVRYFSEVDALFLVGLAEFEHGAQGAGVVHLSEVVGRLPELWRANVYLAAALGAQGRADLAIQLHRGAMAVRTDPVVLEASIVPIFAAAAERSPDDAWAHYLHGQVLAEYGRFGEALAPLRRAQALEPRPEFEGAIAAAERALARQALD